MADQMDSAVEDDGETSYKDVADPVKFEVRVCADLCSTCIYRPGNLMHLEPGRVAGMVRDANANNGHIVCHDTVNSAEPAICRGFANADRGSSLALRFGRMLGIIREIVPPAKRTPVREAAITSLTHTQETNQ